MSVAFDPTIEARPSIATADRTRRLLEAFVRGPFASSLSARRWFGAKGRAVASVSLVDHAILPLRPLRVLAVVEVAFADGARARYFTPFSIDAEGAPADAIYARFEGATFADALADPAMLRALLAIVVRGRTLVTDRGGAIRGHASQRLPGFLGGAPIDAIAARPLGAEQSNSSIVFSPHGVSRLLMKAYRRLESGMNIEAEIGAHLTEVGFGGVPFTLGEIAYSSSIAAPPITLAILQELVENVGDGWKHALACARSEEGADRVSREPYDAAMRKLGTLTAEMHLALADGRGRDVFGVEPFSVRGAEAWIASGVATLDRVIAWLRDAIARGDRLPSFASEVVEVAPSLRARLERGRALAGVPATRIHGDYHLGQVLRLPPARGAIGWAIVDFEGEPARSREERRAKSPPLRDVAGMLRSFDYAAATAAREVGEVRARAWRDASRAAFLDGYTTRVDGGGAIVLPAERARRREALTLFELDKALYELSYEIAHRPDWVAIPLAGVHAIARDALS